MSVSERTTSHVNELCCRKKGGLLELLFSSAKDRDFEILGRSCREKPASIRSREAVAIFIPWHRCVGGGWNCHLPCSPHEHSSQHDLTALYGMSQG